MYISLYIYLLFHNLKTVKKVDSMCDRWVSRQSLHPERGISPWPYSDVSQWQLSQITHTHQTHTHTHTHIWVHIFKILVHTEHSKHKHLTNTCCVSLCVLLLTLSFPTQRNPELWHKQRATPAIRPWCGLTWKMWWRGDLPKLPLCYSRDTLYIHRKLPSRAMYMMMMIEVWPVICVRSFNLMSV